VHWRWHNPAYRTDARRFIFSEKGTDAVGTDCSAGRRFNRQGAGQRGLATPQSCGPRFPCGTRDKVRRLPFWRGILSGSEAAPARLASPKTSPAGRCFSLKPALAYCSKMGRRAAGAPGSKIPSRLSCSRPNVVRHSPRPASPVWWSALARFKSDPHMLRHACGFALANKGHHTRSLQAYLGHKNIQHTVRYTELSPETSGAR
jgi:hypothetical protein